MLRLSRLFMLLGGIGLLLLEKFWFLGYFKNQVKQDFNQSYTFLYDHILHTLGSFKENFNLNEQLERENQQLHQQLIKTSFELAQNRFLNSAIKELSVMSNLPAKFKGQIASITLKAGANPNLYYSPFLHEVLLNKGSSDGVRLLQAVITSSGVLGQIDQVNEKSSKVLLTTSSKFQIYLQDQQNSLRVLATGTGQGDILLNYLPQGTKLQVGTVLYTTGLDNIYPGGLPVLVVNRIVDLHNGFIKAWGVSTVNLNNSRYVLVLASEAG